MRGSSTVCIGLQSRVASACTSLAFSLDDKALVMGTHRGELQFWTVSTVQLQMTWDWHLGPVRGLDFSPEDQLLASASADGRVRIWPWQLLLRG